MRKPPNIHIVTRLPTLKAKRGVVGRPFEKGCAPGPGRPKGAKDKLSREIRQCLLDACEHVGERIAQRDAEALKKQGREIDLDAPRGLTAFFEWVALEYPQVACAMLARLMPTQQQTEVKVEHTYHTMEEIAARLRELGLEPRRIYPLLTDEKKPEDEVH
jgi:hypothetical protein